MDRKHVEIILKVQKKYIPIFHKVTVPDEHFFASVLCNEGRVSELIPKQTTFVDWDVNNFWFLKKQQFFLKWGLHVEKAGGSLPSKMPNSKLIGRLPKAATKEWKEIQQLDAKMWSEDLVAHPRTFKNVTQADIDKMRLSKSFFARKFSVESNYSTVFTMDVLAKKIGFGSGPGLLALTGENMSADDGGQCDEKDSKSDSINMITGRYDVPKHIQSQLFYDTQSMVAYIDSTIRELDAKHKYEIDKLNNAHAKKMSKALSKQKNELQKKQQQSQADAHPDKNAAEEAVDYVNEYDNGAEETADDAADGMDGLLLSPALLLSNFEENCQVATNNDDEEDDHSDILDIIKNVRAEEADENMAKKLLSHYDTYRNYDEDEYDLEDDEEDDGGMNTFEAHYSFDGQGLDYDDQDDEEEDEEVMLGF